METSVQRLLGIAALQVRAASDAEKQDRGTGGASLHRLSRVEFDALPTAPGSGVTEWRTFGASGRRVYWSKDVSLKLSPAKVAAYTEEAPVGESEPIVRVLDQVASDMASRAGQDLAEALAGLVALYDGGADYGLAAAPVAWQRARDALKIAGR